ncbi:MAG: (Fe-S)-binding protein, partial [Gemmatimonadota bacterium]
MPLRRAAPRPTRPRVRFFATCLGDRFFADAARDALRLLRSLGVEVDVPDGLTCCGQPAWNAGHEAEARTVARYLGERLAGDVPVVLPSGSCAGMMRRSFPRLGAHAPPVYELAEYVVDVLGVRRLGRGLEGVRVAYHHGCHALRELGARDQPLALLEGAGAEVVPWEAAEECCGFGGLFAVKLPWVSAAMADRKLDTLPSRADVLASADGGCLLQLGGRLRTRSGADGGP